MVVGLQQIENKPVASYTWYSGDNLDIKVIHPSQKKMTKKQWTGNRLITASMQQIDSGLMAVL